VWAAVKLVSETYGSVPLTLFKLREGKGKDPDLDHPLFEKLALRPNPEQTSMEWREMMESFTTTAGNGYSEITFTSGGDVEALWPIPPHRVRPVRVRDTQALVYEVRVPDGPSRFVPPERMIHIRSLIRDGLLGTDTIRKLQEGIGLAIATEAYGSSFFGNGSTPAGAIEVPEMLSDTAYTRLKDSWEEKHRGLDNAHRVALLEEGAKWVALGFPPEASQYLETRKFQIAEVARIFGVPPHMIGDLDRSTFNNIEQQSLEFVIYSMRSRVRRSEMVFNYRLLSAPERRTHVIKFDLNELLRGDLKSRYESYAIGRQNSWLSPNDVRDLEDMNPIETDGGDDYHLMVNLIPLQDSELLGSMEPAPESNSREMRAQQRRSVAGRIRTKLSFERLLLNVAKRSVQMEVRAIRRLVERNLRDSIEFTRELAEFYEQHKKWLRDAFGPVFRSFSDSISGEAADELGRSDLDPIDDFTTEYIDTFVIRQSESSRGHLEKLIRETPPDEQAQAIEDRLDSWEETKPGRIARREAQQGMNAFSYGTYAAAGVLVLRWVTIGDNCPFCDQMDGRTVGVNKGFVKAGDTLDPGGVTPLTFTRVHKHPPIHDGCDCTIVAV
jgi:HK97 family phage portal protein